MKFITIAILCALLLALASCTTNDTARSDSETLRELRSLGVGAVIGSSGVGSSLYLIPDTTFNISCQETLDVLLDVMDIITSSGSPGTHFDTDVVNNLSDNGLWDAFNYQHTARRLAQLADE